MAAPMYENPRLHAPDKNDIVFPLIWMRFMRMAVKKRRRRALKLCRLARERRARFLQHQESQRTVMVLILLMLMATIDPERMPRRMWMKCRLRRYWNAVYYGDLWEPVDWTDNLRMSRRTFEHICGHIRHAIERQDTAFRLAVPHHERLAITLWKLATPIEYRTLGQKFGLGRSTICSIVHDTCKAICEILQPIYIKFPTGQRLNSIVHDYERRWGFPQCVGAIDGMHVSIKGPVENAADYFNRKFVHSIVLQGMCDSQYRFVDLFFGFAGRAHDARILANSGIYQTAIRGQLLPDQNRRLGGRDVPLVVIGDPAYPLLPWLMKPFAHRGILTADQTRFNYRLSRARMTIENTFGRLKARWRCLLKKNEFDLDNVHKIVLACCVLHNICEIHNERLNANWRRILQQYDENNPIHMVPQQVDRHQIDVQSANEIREALVRYFQH